MILPLVYVPSTTKQFITVNSLVCLSIRFIGSTISPLNKRKFVQKIRSSKLLWYTQSLTALNTQGADKSLARPGRKQARKHVRDVRDFNNIETRVVVKLPPAPLQGKAPKEIHSILTETLACFLPGRAKDLSAPMYKYANDWTPPQPPQSIHVLLSHK